ncbi:WAP four-disulfide core domain protein 3 [Eublepharis macularius]|uniref:WAP four-disulfide core domain protein 3 n=1 Tax=Eublepharis macularius TaxID=481883 RepID=A0AA97JFF1_EUBMA|nr:WAP four-disulfide core domain protein 3 [Eublepharis macularius]
MTVEGTSLDPESTMKPEVLWWLMGLLMLRDGEALDYGEEKIGKAGYCPTFPSGLFQPPCTVKCEADSECEGPQKCCEFACRYSCMLPSRDKPGMCATPPMKKLYAPLPCTNTCVVDEDCSGAQKCCEAAGGRTCNPPLPGKWHCDKIRAHGAPCALPQKAGGDQLYEKPGKCPKKKPQKSASPSPDTCFHDQECFGAEKCCFTGSSMNCLPVEPDGRGGAQGSRPGKDAARAWAWAGRGAAQ